MQGAGRFVFASGASYCGTWRDNKYDGAGTYSWPDGSRYEVRAPRWEGGRRRDRVGQGVGLREGVWGGAQASCTPASHVRFSTPCRAPTPQGQWLDGRMHGQGAFVDAEGRRWAGQFYNGSGPGLTYQLG